MRAKHSGSDLSGRRGTGDATQRSTRSRCINVSEQELESYPASLFALDSQEL